MTILHGVYFNNKVSFKQVYEKGLLRKINIFL